MNFLFLDDIRNPEDATDFQTGNKLRYALLDRGFHICDFKTNVVRTYEEFVAWVETYGIPDIVSFDHDLGDEEPEEKDKYEKTGYDAAKYLIDKCLSIGTGRAFPTHFCHSANPIGAENILGAIKSYTKFIKNGNRNEK